MPAVHTEHKTVAALKSWWLKVEHCTIGPRAVKAEQQTYLPKLKSHGRKIGLYEQYHFRALFQPVVRRTWLAFLGLVFAREPEVKLPKAWEKITKDATGTGVPFRVFCKQVFGQVLAPGRCGILVDAAQEREGVRAPVRPFLSWYKAANILNHRYESVEQLSKRCRGTTNSRFTEMGLGEGSQVLALITLRECTEEVDPNDKFITKEVEKIREIELRDVVMPDGEITVGQVHQLWRQATDPNGRVQKDKWVVDGPPITPLRRGDPIPFIPFIPVNPLSLTMEPDEPPLLGMAEINLSQYRTSADLENGRHKVGHPQLYCFGVDDPGKELYVGDLVWTSANPAASAGAVQVASAFAALELAMREKDEQMVAEGARLMAKTEGPAETATATIIKKAGERSLLATMADTAGIQFSEALAIQVWWAMETGKLTEVREQVSCKLNDDFENQFLTGAEAEAWLRVQVGGGMSRDSYLRLLERNDVFPPGRTADQERALIEEDQAKVAAMFESDLGDGGEVLRPTQKPPAPGKPPAPAQQAA